MVPVEAVAVVPDRPQPYFGLSLEMRDHPGNRRDHPGNPSDHPGNPRDPGTDVEKGVKNCVEEDHVVRTGLAVGRLQPKDLGNVLKLHRRLVQGRVVPACRALCCPPSGAPIIALYTLASIGVVLLSLSYCI